MENPFALPIHSLLREHGIKLYVVASRLGITVPRLKSYLYGDVQPPCHVRRVLDEIQKELEAKGCKG